MLNNYIIPKIKNTLFIFIKTKSVVFQLEMKNYLLLMTRKDIILENMVGGNQIMKIHSLHILEQSKKL